MPHANDHRKSSQNFFRLATWVLGFVVMIVVILVVAKEFGTVERREDRTVGKLMAQWKDAGLAIGEVLPADNPFGAMQASEADIGGTPVLVYQFDPFNAKQVQTLDKIKADGNIMHDGEKTPAIVNGPFVLAGYAEHPNKEQIVQTFQGFGTFEGIEAEQKLAVPPK